MKLKVYNKKVIDFVWENMMTSFFVADGPRQKTPSSMVADLCQSTICRLFVMSWRKDDRMTRRQNDDYRIFAPKRQQNDKMKSRQN
jgi:hypothetical protein